MTARVKRAARFATLAMLFCLGSLLLGGCSLPTFLSDLDGTQYVVFGREELEVPIWYETEWNQAVSCVEEANARGISGRPRGVRFQDIAWYLSSRIVKDGETEVGAISKTDQLYIIVTIDWWGDWRVIRHESLHQILGQGTTHGQGSFYFCDPFKTPRD